MRNNIWITHITRQLIDGPDVCRDLFAFQQRARQVLTGESCESIANKQSFPRRILIFRPLVAGMSVSDEDSSVGSPFKPATPTPTPGGQERTKGRPGPENMRHQHSFEARYSSIIQKQIWETSINKDVLERQLNAYLPFSRSASLNKDGSGGFDQLMPSGSTKARSLRTTPTRRPGPCLEKLETVDVADHQAKP
ncbi:uncharacterized protein LOC6593096 [Drosophila persimilis]|uniref:uncharacterized protein LOC6593096 n=1 Tax=Drosophila persimilis TaxID=7234 RepID=UPI000F077BA7|nr:uncharacterized protein LOC6593096 [Drosophila persimilis]